MIDFKSKVNIIISVYIVKLYLVTLQTDICAQKFHNLIMAIYEIVIASLLLKDKLEKVWFFKKTFLLADINSLKRVLIIFFLNFLDKNVQFIKIELE